MLTDDQQKRLSAFVAELNPIQQAWVSGYLAAAAQLGAGQPLNALANGPVAASANTVLAPSSLTVTVLFGSQTGNAKHVAKDVAAALTAAGVTSKLVDMADYKPNQLKTEQALVIVTSTYGEGEPPENAVTLHEFVHGKKAPNLAGLAYAVLGLGDTSYEFFCKTAQDFDQRLAALGGTAIVARADLDVDYQTAAQAWTRQLVQAIQALNAPAANSAVPNTLGAAATSSQYNKQAPFTAELLVNQKITGRDSEKDVRHLEISLADSGLSYQPGDALGVYFHNDPVAVANLLAKLQLAADTPVTVDGQAMSLQQALVEHFELTQSYPGFVEKYVQASQLSALINLVADKAKLRSYLADKQIYDIVAEHPAPVSAEQLIASLRKLQPRLYSIASSQTEVEDEVHITVGVVRYQAFASTHLGGASGYLAERLAEGDTLRVFIEHNSNFRLPSDSNTPVIMVGPGTGIAPFRAFLQQRDADGAAGKNWLFFGNPHFTQDFLYQVELQDFLKRGVLTHLDVAFSRDQAQKVYVQDKLRKQGAQVYQWLEQGAHFYVCGDANRMAKDVHSALLDIIKQHGGKDDAAAEAYLTELRVAKRYQKDVY